MSVYATQEGTRFHKVTCRSISKSSNIEKVSAQDIKRRNLSSCRVCNAESPKPKTVTKKKNSYDDDEDDVDDLGTELMKLTLKERPSNERFLSPVEVLTYPRPVQKPSCLSQDYSCVKSLEQEFKQIVSGAKLYKSCEVWVHNFTGNRRGLTEEQLIAIRAYTGNEMYRIVNKALYENDAEGWETTIHCIYTGLRKLCMAKKVKKSLSSRVFRGMDKLADVKVGYTIQMRGFNSTSKSEIVARKFAHNGTLFRVLSWRVGAKIAFLSVYPDEEEVLIEPYASFKVKAITKEDGLTFVDLEHCNTI